MPCPRRSLAANRQPAADAASLAQLRGKLLRYAKRELRNADAAEDATQEAMLALYLAPGQFRGEARFDVYAIGVLRHKIADVYRSGRRELPVDDETLEDLLESREAAATASSPAGDETERMGTRQEALRFWRTLRKCLHALPERTRSAYVMHDVQEWDVRAVCDHLGITAGHVSVLTHRARAHLRRHWHDAERSLASA